MSESGYVCAGFETLATIVNNFMLGKKGRWDNNFTREEVSFFLRTKCHGFLHSFGQNFSGRKKFDKYVQTEKNLFKKCRDTGLFDGCNFIVDSGGFQASIGALEKNETRTLINLYYEFLRDHHEVIDRAFILDLPPGPNCKIFDSFDDVYRLNLETYKMARDLPKESRDKIIYIHHFRTPKLWDIYTDILVKEKMFEHFKYFATGGIVANMASDTAIPCIIYVIPLIPLINQALKYKQKKLCFHILGGATFRDILFYELFRTHVKNMHGLELEITYDSSGLFKGLMIGRFFSFFDNKSVRKVDIRTENLNKRYSGHKTISNIIQEAMNLLYDKYKFKKVDASELYDPATGSFYEDLKVYLMFYVLDLFSICHQFCKDSVIDNYQYYQSGDLQEFNDRMLNVTKALNNNKITRKQKAKTNSISKSLDILTSLDEDYCYYLVKRFLSKDEFVNLEGNYLLTI